MPFQKGRAKTGGKVKGSKHKITRDLVALLDELKCNPIEGMAKIATDEKIDIAIRLRAHAEVAKYVHPQLKAIELSGPGGGPIQHDVSADELLRSELSRIAARSAAK
jgi:hypothetical protein